MKLFNGFSNPLNKGFNCFLIFLVTLIFSSCSSQDELIIDYSFETAKDVNQDLNDFEQIDFTPNTDLDLGFYKGAIWIKLNITNTDEIASYIVLTDDFFNRNYRFYKLDSLSHTIITLSEPKDLTKHDHRTFDSPKPNFEINLQPNEKATFFITTTSDGRIVKATPKLCKVEDYTALMKQTTTVNVIFFIAIGMLFLINIFHWSIVKSKMYYYYSLYILASCLFYVNVEGYFTGLITNHAIDHLVFISIRIWVFTVALFSSKFLEFDDTNPKTYKLMKWILLSILGSTTLYQFVFYNSSIAHLHLVENIFGFIWIIFAGIMIIVSFKKRKLQAKYYLLAFSFLVFFIVLGLANSHTAMLPGDPFSYFKVGMIIEFMGFTYFISLIIKRNLKKSAILENELIQNKKELSDAFKQLESNIEKTDILSIFKLLESSLSKDEEWPEFKAKFKELSPNFLANLKQAHPNLSKSEIRLLTLIQIGFTQKEIANILNIAPDSVKKAKHRVRKKLELSSETNLNTYLAQYS